MAEYSVRAFLHTCHASDKAILYNLVSSLFQKDTLIYNPDVDIVPMNGSSIEKN